VHVEAINSDITGELVDAIVNAAFPPDWRTAVQATLHCLKSPLPISRWMISRGRGHAVVHGHH